MQEAGDYLLG